MNHKTAEYICKLDAAGWSDQGGMPMVLDVSGMSTATVQAVSVGTTAWSTGQLTVKRANIFPGDGVQNLETTTHITNSADMTGTLDVSGFKYLIVTVSTDQAGVTLRVAMYAQEF